MPSVHFVFFKVTLHSYNFGVSVYKGSSPIYEIKFINLWWLLYKYSTVKFFSFLEMTVHSYNLRVSIYKRVIPHTWNESHHSTMLPRNTLLLKILLSEIRVYKQPSVQKAKVLIFPLDKMTYINRWWLLLKYSTAKKIILLKGTLHIYTFRVPVYEGVITPYMKWNPCFYDDYYLNILLLKFHFLKTWFASRQRRDFRL